MRINVKLTDGAPLPRHAKPGDAGMDLTSRQDVTLEPGETAMVGTGVAMEIPEGYVGLVFPRSGLGSRGLTLSNCVGVIDSSYRGEIKAPLHNNHPACRITRTPNSHGAEHPTLTPNYYQRMHVERGDRVCQIVIVPYLACECVDAGELSETDRGGHGFGSTGT